VRLPRDHVGLDFPSFIANNYVVAGSAFAVFFRGVVNGGGNATGLEVSDCEVFGWPSTKVAVGEEFVGRRGDVIALGLIMADVRRASRGLDKRSFNSYPQQEQKV
jgi:hypothetical protein